MTLAASLAPDLSLRQTKSVAVFARRLYADYGSKADD